MPVTGLRPVDTTEVPDPDVPQRAIRRRFSAEYKLQVRFYYNLLARGLAKAEALRDAKSWLSHLTREDIAGLAENSGAALRGIAREIQPRRGDGFPFADPFFWAGFALVGEP